MTVLLGVGYPTAVWAAGQAFGDRADGSPVRLDGEVVGSRLLGQQFEGDEWFLPRPSAERLRHPRVRRPATSARSAPT